MAKGALLADAINRDIKNWKYCLETKELTLSEIIKEHHAINVNTQYDYHEYEGEMRSIIKEKLSEEQALKRKFINDENLIEICFTNYPKIYRVDPMSMRSVSSDMIYHERTIQIGNKDYLFKADGVGVLTRYEESIWQVKSIFVPLDISDYKTNEILGLILSLYFLTFLLYFIFVFYKIIV